jgi:hypothetical protein
VPGTQTWDMTKHSKLESPFLVCGNHSNLQSSRQLEPLTNPVLPEDIERKISRTPTLFSVGHIKVARFMVYADIGARQQVTGRQCRAWVPAHPSTVAEPVSNRLICIGRSMVVSNSCVATSSSIAISSLVVRQAL